MLSFLSSFRNSLSLSLPSLISPFAINKFIYAVVYSWQINSLKPAKKNFEETCKRLGVKPNECIFVDDVDKNVDTAESLGMKAIQFKDVEQLKKALVFLLS